MQACYKDEEVVRTEVRVRATAFAAGKGSTWEPSLLWVAVAAAQAAVVAVAVAVVATTALSAAAVAVVHLASVLAVAVVQASVMGRAEYRPVQTRQAVGRHSAARFVAVFPVRTPAMERAESLRLGRSQSEGPCPVRMCGSVRLSDSM